MEFDPKYRWGFLALVILQIISIFYLLRVYDNFVSNPENYYKNILTGQLQEQLKN